MSLYNNNPGIRSRTMNTVNQNIGRIILLNLARSGVALIVLAIFWSMSGSSFINAIDRLDNYSSSYIQRNPEIILDLVTPFLTMLTLPVLISSLLSNVLNLGYINGQLRLLRGETVKASVVLSRLRHVLASIGLPIWVSLKTSVWALPGALISVVGTQLAQAATATEMYIFEDFSIAHVFYYLGLGIMIAGGITTFVMTVQAAYRYAMANHVLADDPSLGVYDSVERSKAMMAGRKWQLFKLTIPYLLLMLAFVLGTGLLIFGMGLLPYHPAIRFAISLISLAAITLLTVSPFYFGLLSEMAVTCFYEESKH